MNLESITTPADLVAQNNEPVNAVETAVKALKEVGFEDTVKITSWLLDNMFEYHNNIIKELIEERAENVAIWVADAEKLRVALSLVEQITID